MLMHEEFKKNIGFFILMAIVLTLLMAAGVSIFNFSFEIDKQITEQLSPKFEYGYNVIIEEFIEPESKRMPGVDYYTYHCEDRVLLPLPEGYPYNEEDLEEENEQVWPLWLGGVSYYFENYLPKNFLKAMSKYDDFLISGSFWTESDNNKINGLYPIFLSDSFVYAAKELGIYITVGGTISTMGFIRTEDNDIEILAEMDFIVKGIYRYNDLEWRDCVNIPYTVIPLSAELEFRKKSDWQLVTTYVVVNSIGDLKQFTSFAKNNGIKYTAYVEEDLQLISLFSSIFAVVSIVILALSGFIAFIYCGMFINKRINFIGLIKALGMSDFSIAKQFLFMLVIVFGFAFIAGNIFSIFLTSHFTNLALTLFDYELSTGFNVMSQLVFCLLTALTAVLSVFLLYRRIKKISIAKVLTQKE